MPGIKKKTHKGMAKRFKLTGSGKKLKRMTSGMGHLMQHKSGDKVRQLRKRRVEDTTRPSLKKIAHAIS
jgi:large subunit ribosomal protein L35